MTKEYSPWQHTTHRLLFLAFVLTLPSTRTYAAIYKCPGPGGQMIFSDAACANGYRKSGDDWVSVASEARTQEEPIAPESIDDAESPQRATEKGRAPADEDARRKRWEAEQERLAKGKATEPPDEIVMDALPIESFDDRTLDVCMRAIGQKPLPATRTHLPGGNMFVLELAGGKRLSCTIKSWHPKSGVYSTDCPSGQTNYDNSGCVPTKYTVKLGGRP